MSNETIGRCEGFCGTVDHHLVDGLCAQCRAKSKTIPLAGEHSCNDPLREDVQAVVREVAIDPLADAYREALNVEVAA